jgi:hypothetical protein
MKIALAIVCFILLVLVYVLVTPNQRIPIPDSITHIALIREGLLKFAEKHHGQFPEGNTSLGVFQKLVDDGDLKSGWFYFPMPGKVMAISDKLLPENVCFDFTKGVNANSPDWVPLVFSTGYSVDYETGKTIRTSRKYSVDHLTAKAIKYSPSAPDDEPLAVAYTYDVRFFLAISYHYFFFRTEATSFNIMPGKPTDADVSQYQQLTPEGHL